MTIAAVLKALEIAESDVRSAMWVRDWEPDGAEADDAPPVLEPEYIGEASARLGLSERVRDLLLQIAPGLQKIEAASVLAAHLTLRLRRMQHDVGALAREVADWPPLSDERSGVPGLELLPAFVWLGCVDYIEQFYREREIPKDVLADTMRDIGIWIDHHRERTGRWGLSQNRWLIHHFAGNLFRLGRLQFQFGTSHYPYYAWRKKVRNGPVLLLADNGLRFSRDGLEARRESDDRAAALPLVSRYEEGPDAVSGLPVHPCGYALDRTVRLPRKTWTCVWKPGSPVLNVHIPAGEPMAFDACGESFRRSIPFFRRHFPEYRWNGWTCGSWLLDPQFDGRLRESSNIVRFLREFYLFPLPGAVGHSHFERVFGTRDVDPRTAPRDTSLRRVLLDHVTAGGRWREGGGVIFPEDLDWGARVYRRMFASGIDSLLDFPE